MEFSRKLKELRNGKGVTQEELAKAIFVSRSLVARYENGTSVPNEETMERIVEYFGIEFGDLFDEKETAIMSLRAKRGVKVLNLALNALNLIVSALFLVLSPLRIFTHWRYSSPSLPGETPFRESYQFSILEATLSANNPIVVITMVISIVSIIVAVGSFFLKGKVRKASQILAHLAFGLVLIMSILSFMVGFSIETSRVFWY